MSQKTLTNVATSVRQKLLNRSREQKEDFQLVLTRYALERLLYRLSQSKHVDEFVLKGAFLFLIWIDAPYRPTRDVDLLGFGDSSAEHLIAVFKTICDANENDGLIFETESLSAEEIREQQEYNGIRLTLVARLEQAEIPLQIDVGFGDIVTPTSKRVDFPTILDMPPPSLRAYSKESVISEKYEAMVRLGIANSRMKDFYDIWVLSKNFDFEGLVLAEAIRATFSTRKTALSKDTPIAFSEEFFDNPAKQAQWKAFVSRSRLKIQTDTFENIIADIYSFLAPPTEALLKKELFTFNWSAEKGWTEE